MKLEKYINDNGEFRCFGFPNLLIGKKDVLRILETVPEIEVTRFSNNFGEEIFCEFKYGNKTFIASEPYGDNSFYDISCETPNTDELNNLYEIFSSYELKNDIKQNDRVRLLIWSLTVIGVIWLNLLWLNS